MQSNEMSTYLSFGISVGLILLIVPSVCSTIDTSWQVHLGPGVDPPVR